MVKRINYSFKAGKVIFTFLLTSLTFYPLTGQDTELDYFYRIYFRDKGENLTSNFTPSELFSERAIERRNKNGIQGLDLKDLPVYTEYLDNISSMGLKLHCTSRWMNTGLFKSYGPADINSLQALSFVDDVKIVKNPVGRKGYSDKLSFEIYSGLNIYDEPILMLNGQLVHGSGYGGTGKMIAVLDGGFINTDRISSLNGLRSRNGIIGTYDFVEKGEFVYDYHKHGTAVMSILAGDYQGFICGSANGADYLLLRTEDTFSEFPVEEDFWAAGAEFADSAGCDIITSSLGYFKFDDPSMDYKYSDMDGKSSFVTLAAETAASRGIVVVNSAGNERDNDWIHIIAPSDGANVLSVGAVDRERTIAPFSSAGPSYDGRIKPDIVAQGIYVPVQTDLPDPGQPEGTSFGVGSGTSFSCPLISGMLACVMQAVPEATASDILSIIRSVSDRYNSPDSLYGYGIPDILKAVTMLQKEFINEPSGELSYGPNPFTEYIKFTFRENPERLNIEIFDALGRNVRNINYLNYISLTFTLNDFQNLKHGLYIIRLTTAQGTFVHKVIKAGR